MSAMSCGKTAAWLTSSCDTRWGIVCGRHGGLEDAERANWDKYPGPYLMAYLVATEAEAEWEGYG